MITQELVRELFSYELGKLYWRISPVGHVKPGTRAGCQEKGHYWKIGINGREYREHRLIFLFFHGYMPKYIDHISDELTDEGIKDNHICNLRQVAKGANLQKSPRRRGRSKYRGVIWFKRDSNWQAGARFKDHQYHLGYFDNEEDAAKAYDKFVIDHYDEYAYLNFPESRGELSAQNTTN